MADLTESEIIAVRKAQVGRYGMCDVTKPYSDSIAFGQAVIKAQREKDAAGVPEASAPNKREDKVSYPCGPNCSFPECTCGVSVPSPESKTK